MEKLVAKLKVKLREHAKGIAGYQFLAACKLFRSEVAPGQRKGGRISAEDFRRVVESKFGMKLDPDEVLTLFHFLVPGAGGSIEISAMVRAVFLFLFRVGELVERLCPSRGFCTSADRCVLRGDYVWHRAFRPSDVNTSKACDHRTSSLRRC